MVAQEYIRPIVIGIHGKSASGKDTLASYLHNEILRLSDELYPTGSEIFIMKVAFADAVRAGVGEMFDIDQDDFHDRELKDSKIEWLGMSPTEILQTVGQAMREANPDTWIAVVRRKIKAKCNDIKDYDMKNTPNLVVIVPDVRYSNEVDFIKSFFAEDKSPSNVMIWIKREDQAEVSRRADHISERAIEDEYMKARADVVVTNRRDDMEALKGVAKTIVDVYVRSLIQ